MGGGHIWSMACRLQNDAESMAWVTTQNSTLQISFKTKFMLSYGQQKCWLALN